MNLFIKHSFIHALKLYELCPFTFTFTGVDDLFYGVKYIKEIIVLLFKKKKYHLNRSYLFWNTILVVAVSFTWRMRIISLQRLHRSTSE